jgi:hypothetical protein
MKMNIKKSRHLFLAAIIISVALLTINSQVVAQSFKLSGVSDMVRVFEDGYKLPQMYDSINLFGIRGEIISGQFVINAKKSLMGVTVEISELKNSSTGISMPSASAEWNFVGSIPLAKNTPNQPVSHLVRQAPARFPEYLMNERQLDVKEKTWKSVWLTVSVPEKAAAGSYTGKVTVRSGQESQSLPLRITVFPLTIPSDRHLKVVEWYSTGGFKRFYGIQDEYSPEWFAMLKKYADNFVAHRQNTFRVPMESIIISVADNGELKFDFTRFDQIAQVFWNTGKMDLLETGEVGVFGEDRWASTKISLDNYKVKKSSTGEIITMPGIDVLPYFLPSIESHLRGKGWLKKTIFSIKDEPSLHNALAYREVSAYVHKYAPDLIRFNALESTYVIDELEIAVPKLDHFSNWFDSFRKWQQKGHELWFYTVGIYQGSLFPNKTIDVPLIDSRIMHWLNYKYNATGYLHWGWNQWGNEKPFEDTGMHIGDAWLVYPAKDGVLNSLRWEEMRNGIQDYEYFWMLEKSIKTLRDSLGSRFSWINPKQRGIEIAGQVIQGFADRTYDPQVLNKAKMQLIKETLDFNISPSVYVQTNPREGSAMTMNSSVEVFGWAEPGTKIVVNGQELPVSRQGLFVEQFEVTPDNNKIVVQASGPKGMKRIVRTYAIK